MELKVLKCPNCGANTTDHNNCEYCGSLLVRFADRGMEIDTAQFAADASEYPGLVEELKRNLKLQEEYPDEGACTDIMWVDKNGDCRLFSIMTSGLVLWADGTRVDALDNDKNGLSIYTRFLHYTDKSNDPQLLEVNRNEDEELAKFKRLKSFPLFTSHMCTSNKEGFECFNREYVIDFGHDAEGAAALVAEVLKTVNGLAPTDKFDISTTVSMEKTHEARNAWLVAHGFASDEEENSDDGEGWFSMNTLYYVLAGIIILSSIMKCS